MVCSGLPPCDLGLVTECIPPARDQILVLMVLLLPWLWGKEPFFTFEVAGRHLAK